MSRYVIICQSVHKYPYIITPEHSSHMRAALISNQIFCTLEKVSSYSQTPKKGNYYKRNSKLKVKKTDVTQYPNVCKYARLNICTPTYQICNFTGTWHYRRTLFSQVSIFRILILNW